MYLELRRIDTGIDRDFMDEIGRRVVDVIPILNGHAGYDAVPIIDGDEDLKIADMQLLPALDSKHPTLGLTSFCIMGGGIFPVPAVDYRKPKVSAISVSGPIADYPVEFSVKLALHHLGHNFGLRDHETEAKNRNGKICPMKEPDTFDIDEFVEEIFYRRGFRYCDECDKLIRYGGRIGFG